MKSTRKIFYNHRIAQSKEKWETDFLSKINDANGLLYLAAVKSNNYTPLPKDDSYYTEENKPKILSTLDEIVNNPYNQRHHQKFATFLEEAKSKLDSKTKKPVQAPPAPVTQDPAKPVTPVNPQDSPGRSTAIDQVVTGNQPALGREDLYNIDDFGVDAKIFIKDIINPLKNLAEKDKESFKRDGRKFILEASNKFNDISSKFDDKERQTISTMINNLQAKYVAAFGEAGSYRAGKSFFYVDYIRAKDDAASLLSDKVYLKDPIKIQERRDQLEKILNIYQMQFINKNPGNSDIAQYIAPLNKLIGAWNYRYTNMNPRNNTDVQMINILRPANRV
jgi:hypothetical protein